MHPTIRLEHAPPRPGRPLPLRALLTLAGESPTEDPEGPAGLVARNVVVEVRPAARVWLAAVRHSYPSSPTADGLRLEMGDLHARKPRRLLLELLVEEVPASGDAKLVTLSLAADVPEVGGGIEHRELDLPVRLDLEGGARVDPEVRREALRLDDARARARAGETGRRREWGTAARNLDEAGRMRQ